VPSMPADEPTMTTSVFPASRRDPAAGADGKGRYAFVSLGCPKNLVDSERMLGLMQLDGYQLVADIEDADFAIVNTCGFIDPARAESYGVIEEMLERKRRGTLRGVIVAGCLAERDRQALLEAYPEIDHLVGVFGREEITRVADRLIGGLDEQRMLFRPAATHALADGGRLRVTPRHFAFLKISEGCDRLCTFCAIPRMRGRHVTKPIEQVVAEARELAADGVRELILVAQDTTYYGLDLYGRPRLVELLDQLQTVDGIDWIRLMYLYPSYVTAELIDLVAGSDKIVPYLDLPLQHINDQVLRRMQRQVRRGEIEELLGTLRERIAGLVLRTTLLAGFPGETDAHFEELLEFVRGQRFERLGVFAYCREPGTPADRLGGHVAEEIKAERRRQLMLAQQPIAFQWNADQVGRQRDVLLDAAAPDQQNVWIGRTTADAPDIDSVVFVTGECLRVGQIVPCEIVSTSAYDLVAVPVARSEPARRSSGSGAEKRSTAQ